MIMDDLQRAQHIFGPTKPLLQRLLTRLKPTSNKIEKIALLLPISQHHKKISHTFLTKKVETIADNTHVATKTCQWNEFRYG